MSLLERLKSMVMEMSEEERREFLDDVESHDPITEEQPEEQPEEQFEEEVEDLPEEILCTDEELQEILSLRSNLIQMKTSYGELCISFDNQKLEMLKKIAMIEELLVASADKAKQAHIEDEGLREEYRLLIKFEPEPHAKLIKN